MALISGLAATATLLCIGMLRIPRTEDTPSFIIMQALVDRFGIRFPNAKSGVDTSMVIVAAVLSFLFFGKLNGVREGTIIAALGIGQFVKVWNRFAGNKLTEFLEK